MKKSEMARVIATLQNYIATLETFAKMGDAAASETVELRNLLVKSNGKNKALVNAMQAVKGTLEEAQEALPTLNVSDMQDPETIPHDTFKPKPANLIRNAISKIDTVMWDIGENIPL
ncbi:MAG: hypothetical protein ABIR91_02605 [Candidatus Saccharimonadales bacterium]